MCDKGEGCACDARPVQQCNFNENFIDTGRIKQLIHLMQWLQEESYRFGANNKTIIREFFKKLIEMWRPL